MNDIDYMRRALALAAEAAERDEVPVGAVVVRNGEIIAEASNRREETRVATHHAELIAIEDACRAVGSWRLNDCTLYVTMEPCPMCAGAAVNARLGKIVYGTPDIRFGALGSLFDLNAYPLNHRPLVEGGVLADECREMLRAYFKGKRTN